MSTWVRKDFYLEPPSSNASIEQWETWIKADNKKAIADKAAHTKSLEYCDAGDDLQASSTVKINGVWKQCVNIGVSGSADDISGEVIVKPQQDKYTVWADMESKRCKRGGSRKGKSARRRKNRKGV